MTAVITLNLCEVYVAYECKSQESGWNYGLD